MGLRTYGLVVATAVTMLWAFGGTQHEKPLLAATAPDTVRALEASVAVDPESAEARRALAQAYLDARQSGLAVALIESAPTAVRADVRVRHVYARALLDAGRSVEALAAEKSVLQACRPLAEGRRLDNGCDAVIFVSATRRADILGELVALGVDDAAAHPDMSQVAYANATRQARVMVP